MEKQSCTKCSFGVVSVFWANHDKRQLAEDWYYCDDCYPDNHCVVRCPWLSGNVEVIDIDEYYRLAEIGYTVYPF